MRIQRVAITILLVTVIILGGLTVNWDNQGISTQTAVSQVDETDLQYQAFQNQYHLYHKQHLK